MKNQPQIKAIVFSPISIAFFSIFLFYLTGDFLGNYTLNYIFKPLLMPALIWLYAHCKQYRSLDYKFIIALIFSMFGDVFLMIKEYNLFVFGLGSFLITHIIYTLIFKKGGRFSLVATLPFVMFSVIYFGILKDKLPSELFIPVLIYCTAITIMGVLAAQRNSSTGNYQIVLIGAVLFIVSDSIIAFNKFVNPFAASSFLIMSTYVAAQYLITLGWILEENLSYE